MSSPQRDEVSGQEPGAGADSAAGGPAAGGGAAAGGGQAAWTGPPGGESAVPYGGGVAGFGALAQSAPAGYGARAGTKNPWKVAPDGRTVFRRLAPFVLWWIWIAFAIFNVVQVVIPDHDYFSIEVIAGLLALTGVAYATTLRPRVIASADEVAVFNPIRDHLIRWGAVTGVYLGDSVELTCARPQSQKDKTIYCWALHSNRRSRMKQQQLGVRAWRQGSARAADQAHAIASHDPAQLMAAELGRRATSAREAGAPAATLESRWAFLPIAAILLPAAALLGLLLAR